jgi:hypothetical protein
VIDLSETEVSTSQIPFRNWWPLLRARSSAGTNGLGQHVTRKEAPRRERGDYVLAVYHVVVVHGAHAAGALFGVEVV